MQKEAQTELFEEDEVEIIEEFAKGGKVKIKSLVNRCKEIQTQVALQGITFELVLIDNLTEMLVKTKS